MMVPVKARARSRVSAPESVPERVTRIVRTWSGTAALALLDHGTSAGANFVLQIVLARTLPPVEYGAFNVAYVVYLSLFAVPNFLVFEPMGVLGQRHVGRGLDAYVAVLFRVQLGLSVVLALGLAASRWLYPVAGAAVADASVMFALATPGLIAFSFLRRACYLQTAPGSALAGSAAYAALLLAVTGWRGGVSAGGAAVLMGAAAVAGAAVMITARGWWTALFAPAPRGIHVMAEIAACWHAGKWLLASGLVGWVAASGYLPFAAVLSGLGAAGAVRAVDNLFQPVGHGLTAIASLVGPWLARRRRERGDRFVRSRMWMVGLAVAAAVAVYALGMWRAGDAVIRLLYGPDSAYAAAVPLIPILGAVYVIRGLADVGLGTGLRALGNWRIALSATTVGLIVMVGAGVPLVRSRGVAGILLAMVLTALAQLAVLARAALAARPARTGAAA